MKILVDDRGFSLDLQAFAKKVNEDFSIVFRKIVFLVFNNIVYLTPVDTGRARSNWNVGVNQIDGNVQDFTGSPGQATANAMARARERLSGKRALIAGDAAYITNNVDYILYLEDGTEKMPAFNMVKGAVALVANGVNGVLK